MNSNEWQTFRRRLSETIAWCNIYADRDDLENCLRNVELLPEEFIDNLEDFWINDQRVKTVADKRSALLRAQGKYPNDADLSVQDGRLLVYFPEIDTYDGASCPESGFIGCYPPPETVPPWGMWVQLIKTGNNQSHGETCLVNWIPQIFVELANSAVQVEPLQCIMWIDNPDLDDLALKKRLISEGLL